MALFRKGNSGKSADMTDEDLLVAYKSTENVGYIGELFTRYTHLVMGVCMKYLKNEEESKDCVMQIFEKLLTDLKKQDIHNFKGWLYTVSKNHSLMEIRKKQAIRDLVSNYPEESTVISMENGHPEHLLYENENENNLEKLNHAIGNLNDRQKQCIKLFYLEEKTYKEVADITGFSLKEVKSHIQNGKRNLQIYFDDS